MYTIGTHMSIAGGIAKTAENVVKMNANTMQIFSRNPRGSSYKTYAQEEVEKFQQIRKSHAFGPVLAHAPYTMNLASATEKTYEFACTVIREDIRRMDELKIENLVFHPGSHTGIGEEAGITNIIRGLDQAITGTENIKVLLETMSGKGTEIGYRFEQLKQIRDGVQHPERIGICLDTCHVFAAGYDIVHLVVRSILANQRQGTQSALKHLNWQEFFCTAASAARLQVIKIFGCINLYEK